MNPTGIFPRIALGHLPTPLRRLPGLEHSLGGGHLLVKRDDLTGFALAGNKMRPIEFLLGAAVAEACSVIVSGGAAKSNFAAAIATAAAVAGIECELLFSGPEMAEPPMAVRLARASGARVIFTGGDREDLDGLIEVHAASLTSHGRRAYAVPRGGACDVGALGFANAAFELDSQGIPGDATIVLPVGSGASIAGLVAGRAAVGSDWNIVGVSVSRRLEDMRQQTSRLARSCSLLMGTPPPTDAVIVDASVPAMGVVTDEDRELALLAFGSEGLMFDPSYGVKALRQVRSMVDAGFAGSIVLWHTGGVSGAMQLLAEGGQHP